MPAKSRTLERAGRLLENLGRHFRLVLVRLTQHVAPTPHGFNVVFAIRRAGELLAQLANEDVDDLDLRLIHATVELGEEHSLADCCALTQTQEFQHLVFLAGQVDAGAADFYGLLVKANDEIAGLDDRLSMALGTAHDLSLIHISEPTR